MHGADIFHGYIIKNIPYGENDAVLKLYTAEKGEISVFVKNMKTSQKRFSGSIDRFLYNEFEVVLKNSDKLNILKSSKIINSFYALKSNPFKLILAEHITEIYNNIPGNYTKENFIFFDKTLKFINNFENHNYASFLVMRFNILKLSGIMPFMDNADCKYFSLTDFKFSKEKNGNNSLKLTENQIRFFIGFKKEDKNILILRFTDFEKKIFGKIFAVLYYSLTDKKLLTIKLLKRFF